MRTKGGCGLVALVALLVVTSCLVFAALAGGLVFTGEISLYAPRLTGLEPDPNYAFRPTTPITLTFDQPMNPVSVEAAFVLEPAVPGAFLWNKESTQVTFVPDGMGYEPGTAYTVRLSSGAQAGTLPRKTERTVEWGFSLRPLLDTLEPPPGAEGLDARPLLRAVFHYPLDCAATIQTFSITPRAVGALDCQDQTLTFEPAQSLVADTAYLASLQHVFLDGDPWPRPGVHWEFRTVPPLTVTEVQPVAGGTLSDLWSTFSITFNRPVVADSLVSRLDLSTVDGLPVPGQLSWEPSGLTVHLQPENPLKPATQYQLVLRAGVQDELGFELEEALERLYVTPPMLGQPLPVPGSKEVPLGSVIHVPFARPMDKASVEAGLEFSPALAGEVTWDRDTLVFVPQGGLLPETSYQVSLDAQVRDASGAPLAESHHWAFATEAFLLDAQVPSEAVLVELQQPIEFSFALPMDRASVEAALTISPPTQGNLVWRDDDRTVEFRPDPAWLPDADYEITLAGVARTQDGVQSLGQDRTFAFATAVAEIRFGEGPNVQVMGTGGQRAFQVIARGADVADFRLHVITPTQFLDLYSAGFQGVEPEVSEILDTQSLTPTAEWRQALDPLGGHLYGDWQPAQAHIPVEVPPGIYLLSADPPSEVQGQLLVVLTGHGLLLKRALAGSGDRAQAQIVAWDSELDGGAPVVSATVRLYDRGGALLAEAATDSGGLATLETADDPGPILALSEKDGDLTLCGLGDEWGESGWWWGGSPPSRPLYITYANTDRPIYRPAQSIYFKQIIRADDDASYALPSPDLPVTVRLRDARDNVAASQVLTPTQFGTVHGEFTLADEPMLGIWNLETEVQGTAARQALQVEEYRKPEFEVVVHTPQKAYVRGQAISVTVEADYYFGQPVSAATVQLLAYPVYPDDYYAEGESQFGYPLLSEEGRTDGQGRWEVTLPAGDIESEDQKEQRRVMLLLEATVTDDTGQAVSSAQTVIVQPTSQGLGLVLDRYGYLPNEEILFAAAVRAPGGEPLAGVELTAVVVGWDEREVATAMARTGEAGAAEFSVRLEEQGWYTLRVTGLDDGGRDMLAEDHVWIYDPAGLAPWYEGQWAAEPTLSLSADRQTYAIGDEAQLVINSPLAGPALLTFERGETRQAEPITLTAGTTLITVPIRADYAPNVYVTVNQFGPLEAAGWDAQSEPEAQLHRASTQLLVPMSDRILTVILTAEQDTYGPGEEATFQVQALDHQGEPVVAEVSLAVVDEAIYALAEDTSQDVVDLFYGPRPNGVRTFDSLFPTRWLFPEVPGMGGDGEEASFAPRRDFQDTAYWAPAVITDERGEASVTVQLPDNLTEWRVLARAITTGTLVGQATTRIVVNQDIVVRPVVPRFLLQGDSLSLAAVVHNFTSQPVSATVELALEGLVLEEEASQIIHVPGGGAALASWPVRAEEPGDARLLIGATASRGARLVGRDSVEISLAIHPRAVPELTTWSGELAQAWPTATITLTVPGDVITGLSRLEIDLSPSVIPGLLDGVAYLVGYPYGCVEQTMSRALPNVMVARALGELGLSNQRLEADLPPMIEAGLQKLYGYQHNDGGWGWWYDDGTDVNQTAYVLFGLSMTEQAGYSVDQGVISRGADALRDMLPEADPRAQAYGAFALAMAGQPLSITATLTDALALDLFSQAALATAIDAAGEEALLSGSGQATVAALLDNFRQAAIQDDRTAHWEEAEGDVAYGRATMGSAVRTTAMVLDALVRLDAESPLLPKAVRWLMAQRQGPGWGDTQRTSYSILALTDYLLASQDLAAGPAYRVTLNGALWQEGALDRAEEGLMLTVPITALQPAENSVQLALGEEGARPAGRLYYGLTLTANRALGEDLLAAIQAGERSIGVGREYRLYGSDETATRFQSGDLVEVRLTLDVPEESWYVIVDDPLPAGFEALNEQLGTTSHAAAAGEAPRLHWQDYGYNRKEVRDDRVSFFVTHLAPGEHTFSYLARAATVGSFTALPAQVYPMYEPEVWSRSESTDCQIEPR